VRFAPALLLCGVAAGVMGAAAPAALAESAEAQLRRALDIVAEGRLNAALGDLDRLLERHPNFRFAHLVRGDLLLARAKPLKELGNTGRAAPDGRWKIAYENTLGGQKLRLPESFKSAVTTKGAGS